MNSILHEKLLDKYIKLISDLENAYKEHDKSKYGEVPRSYVITEYSNYKSSNGTIGVLSGDKLKLWMILDSKTVQEISEDVVLSSDYKGMFFEVGRLSFAVDQKDQYVYINWQVGPRYGRGYRYTIDMIGDQIRLSDEKAIWIS